MKHFLCLFVFLSFTVSCEFIAIKSRKYANYPREYIRENSETSVCKLTDPEDLSPNAKSLIFMVHNSVTTIQMIQKMQLEMENVINDMIEKYPKWITTYNLLIFNDLSISYLIETTNSTVFLQGFQQFAAQNAFNTTHRSCKEIAVLESIYIYLGTSVSQKNSEIYIFMNGIMGYGPELFNTVQELVVKTETKINFIQVGAYPCSELITYEGPSLMWNISSISGGEVYVISWPTVIKLMKTFPSHYQNSMISQVLFEDCSVEQIFKFPVDSQTQNINILINGELKEDPTYVNPNGDENDHSVETAYIDYTSNSRFDQIVGSVAPGFWTIKLRTYQGSCSIKITTQSNIFIYPAFVQDENDDIGTGSPFSGNNNYLIAHVSGLNSSLNGTKTGLLQSVTFSSYSNKSFTLKMHLRDSKKCKHEYISLENFQCLPGNYKITFNGVDSNGFDFQRFQTIVCSNGSSKT